MIGYCRMFFEAFHYRYCAGRFLGQRLRRIALFLLLSLGLAAPPLSHPFASTPSGDVQSHIMQPEGTANPYWDNPRQLTSAGGLLFFTAFEPATGWELWKSDGTLSGTQLVKDFVPGPWDSLPSDYSNRRYLIPADDSLYYLASNGGTGQRLYKTDGTPSGTILVAESSGSLSNLTAVNRDLYFVRSDGDLCTGHCLWVSDGTPEGTRRVKEFPILGPDGIVSMGLGGLTQVGSELFFFYRTYSTNELWKSDGTPEGTLEVTTLSGGNTAVPESVNGLFFFIKDAYNPPAELWKSDGTAAGTDNYSGLSWDSVYYATRMNSELFFYTREWANGGHLNFWKTDGTPEGTRRVSEDCSGSDLLSTGSELYFLMRSAENDIELHQSSGGPECARLVKVLIYRLPVWCGKGYGCWARMTLIPQNEGATILTVASNGSEPIKLWATDGTDSGTVLLANLPFPDSDLVKLGEAGFLLVRTESGLDLMRTDGTAAGTQVVKSFEVTSFLPIFLPLMCSPG